MVVKRSLAEAIAYVEANETTTLRDDMLRILRARLQHTSIRATAQALGLPFQKVRAVLHGLNVPLRDQYVDVSDAAVAQAYLSGIDSYTLARQFNTTQTVILHRLKRSKVPLRSRGRRRKT